MDADPLEGWSEEDVKDRIVLPYLVGLGLDRNDLRFEQTFPIRLGTKTHKVGTERVSGRLDILVSRDDQNLLVIEVKKPDLRLGQDDIMQAVSYARLVRPPAPLCVVTNGRETWLIETLSEQIVSREYAKERGFGPITLDEDLCRDALAFLVGYSKECLTSLCRGQVENRLRTLTEAPDPVDRLFIQELFEPRAALDEKAAAFLASRTASCLMVVGESGVGKTSWLVGTARRLVGEGRAVFFYEARHIRGEILDDVAGDLNWGLSLYKETPQATRRMLEVFGSESVILLVDGLDVLPAETVQGLMDEFLWRAPAGRVKMIATCKESRFRGLASRDGVQSRLASELESGSGSRSVVLAAVDDDEFASMVERYRVYFQFGGRIEEALLDECRRAPFLLRLAFEAATREGRDHITHDLRALYDLYLERRVHGRADQPANAVEVLARIGQLLFDKDEEMADVDDVLRQLGLAATESIPEKLIDWRLLLRTEDRQGRGRVGFAWSRIRDYVIAIHACRWDQMSGEEFRKTVESIAWAGVRWDALRTYYSIARSEHRSVLDAPLRANATAFLDTYESLAAAHFSAFKGHLDPHAEGPLGFVGHFLLDAEPRVLGAFGLRALRNGEDRVLLLPLVRFRGGLLGMQEEASAAFCKGIITLRGHQPGSLLPVTPEEVLRDFVEPQLADVIDEGHLDESNSEALLTERVLSAWFRTETGARRQRDPDRGFPVRLVQVLADRLLRPIEHQLVDARIRSGEIEGTRHGRLTSYQINLSPEDRSQIGQRAQAMAESGWSVPPELACYEDQELAIAVRDLRQLAALGTVEIREAPGQFPRKGAPAPELGATAASAIRMYLEEYRKLVERNFPTLASRFRLYRRMPVVWFVTYSAGFPPVHLRMYECDGGDRAENEVILCESKEVAFQREPMTLTHDGLAYRVRSLRISELPGGLEPMRSYMPFDVAKRYCVVRGRVYSQIREEIGEVMKSLTGEDAAAARATNRP